MKKIHAIITGATGMVGEGVLHKCLNHPSVEKVLVINRRPCGITHEKLEEIIHSDFYDFSSLQHTFADYNACYFCMGVSSAGMKEEKFNSLTYDITKAFSNTMASASPSATYCYISGAGTDSTEKGRIMWARVKGKTENHIMALFPSGYAFRPGYIQPMKGMKNTYTFYRVMGPLYPILKRLFPKYVCTLEDLALSMIRVSLEPHEPRILECLDITRIAQE